MGEKYNLAHGQTSDSSGHSNEPLHSISILRRSHHGTNRGVLPRISWCGEPLVRQLVGRVCLTKGRQVSPEASAESDWK